MDVIYLKLISGEELFSKLIGQEDNKLFLDDVLLMETVATPDDSTKYMFMSRYSSYTQRHSMTLDLSKVIYFGEVPIEVRNHYFKSLEFAEKMTDGKLMESIAEATKYLSMVIERGEKLATEDKPNHQSSFDDMEDNPVPPTKH